MILDLASALQSGVSFPTQTPVNRIAAAGSLRALPSDTPDRLSRSTILLVDDELGNLRLLTRLLQRAGCARVISTADPAEGVRLYGEVQPDLLLLDLHMPGMNGLEVLEALTDREGSRSEKPVLMLTGDSAGEMREQALVRGANDFLSKPFQITEVLLRIENLLETRFLYRELREQNRILERTVAARTAALELDIARRERVERELRASEGRYRHLVENASDLIFQADADGTLRYANDAAVRATGLQAHELEGMPFTLLVRPDARRAARRFYLRQLRRRQPSSYYEFPAVTPDGRELWIGQNVRLAMDGSRVVAAHVIGRDVTERRNVERLKDEFISVASHELKTPLTSIRAALALLNGGLLDANPERGRQTLNLASRNADRLARLVNDILDLERLTSGKVHVDRRPYPLSEVLAEAADAVAVAAEQADVLLVLSPTELSASIDPDRIGQVMVNLLSNAVKFSPRGGTIWIRAAAGPDGVTVSVRDHGRGIPADKLTAVFERFRQVTACDARVKGGSGLGLAICKTIVEQHGGEIWVESREGLGSTFSFRIPN